MRRCLQHRLSYVYNYTTITRKSQIKNALFSLNSYKFCFFLWRSNLCFSRFLGVNVGSAGDRVVHRRWGEHLQQVADGNDFAHSFFCERNPRPIAEIENCTESPTTHSLRLSCGMYLPDAFNLGCFGLVLDIWKFSLYNGVQFSN